MATQTLLTSGHLAQAARPALQFGVIVAVIACVAVLAMVVQIVKAMAQAAHTMMRTIAPVFVVIAGTGGVLVLAGVVLAGHA